MTNYKLSLQIEGSSVSELLEKLKEATGLADKLVSQEQELDRLQLTQNGWNLNIYDEIASCGEWRLNQIVSGTATFNHSEIAAFSFKARVAKISCFPRSYLIKLEVIERSDAKYEEGDCLFYSPGDKECNWTFDHLSTEQDKEKSESEN